MKLHTGGDTAESPLAGRKIAVIGYGSQGRAHAANLRDSGCSVVVGLRPGSASARSAREAGFEVTGLLEAVRCSDLAALLVPDEVQGQVFGEHVGPALRKGSTLLFAHGFSVHFGQISLPAGVDVVMVSPKGPGYQLRKEYREGRGLVMLVAVHQDASGQALQTALGYGTALGGGRAGMIETTFREECETDLFGEQAVICGGLSHLVQAGFETLVEAGYPSELAYFECLHEVKYVADLIHRRGIAGMREVISNTARYGDLTRGPRVVGPEVRREMKNILQEIRSGKFAAEWVEESRAGRDGVASLAAREAAHPIEAVGARLRGLPGGGGAEE